MNNSENNRIGLGTAAIGRPQYINIKQDNDEKSKPFSLVQFEEKGMSMLDNAYENGIRHFDTSRGYGIAESILNDWVKAKNDPSIIVSTKWGYTYMANFNPNATLHEIKDHSINTLKEQWSISKGLLPYLKIYQIHSATFESGVLDDAEVLEYLHAIKKSYAIKIGLSTTGDNQVDVLKKAIGIKVQGERLFESFQCTFNVLDQSILDLKSTLSCFGGELILKEVLANGRLLPNEQYYHYSNLYNFINSLADKYDVRADAIVLRYAMDSFPNALVLSGANNGKQLRSNLKVNSFRLSPSDMEQLNAFGIGSTDYWNERKKLKWN